MEIYVKELIANIKLYEDWDFEAYPLQKHEAEALIKVLEPKPTKWINIGSLSMVCSECGLKSPGNTPYCPWCGKPKYHADSIKELEYMQEAEDEQ